ncbi:Ubiquinone biosynthesis hydroxylase, UbiH/UbiF/VisC/COQ6 family [Nitrosomonas sp. Nm51]|uniref:UbiH/UbiF family hydroxylase n=1 Tax=Nitrosomonas sp. Nm51 TaxID=133720 RepID=UPI0008C09386|nr:UbiH/UbiF family hydroxylase [Nitrosomonas sp. Nm51]SER67523.1 Ubiquinone biosynthesis hydroxylase, UbiH/UbiF/VisC/COQ6 family [Nitrosomonas sp. Nm51]
MKFDMVVIGGGLVGASLVTALKASGLKTALIESREPLPLPEDESWDSRVYAISPGSIGFLHDHAIWQRMDASRVAPVYDMAVFGDDSSSHIQFSAYEAGMAELACIVENRQLQTAVWTALQSQNGSPEIFCPAQCAAITWHASHAEIRLEDGRQLDTALVVGADGVNSWVRQQANIAVSRHPYQQNGVVANFSTGLPHRNVAHQWFRRDGVLALLPLPGSRISMVWSTDDAHAAELRALSDEQLCRHVEEAASHTFSELRLITPPAGFPLNFVHVSSLVKPRLVLVGDAAHGIHPLAGQGVNLGLRDVRKLAEILNDRGLQADVGDFTLLRRYECARKEDILAMELVTDGLQKLFINPDPTLARLRNLGLEITNRLPLIKNQLMQHALS